MCRHSQRALENCGDREYPLPVTVEDCSRVLEPRLSAPRWYTTFLLFPPLNLVRDLCTVDVPALLGAYKLPNAHSWVGCLLPSWPTLCRCAYALHPLHRTAWSPTITSGIRSWWITSPSRVACPPALAYRRRPSEVPNHPLGSGLDFKPLARPIPRRGSKFPGVQVYILVASPAGFEPAFRP